MTSPDPVDPAVPVSASAPQPFGPVGPLAASATAPGRYPVLSNRMIGWAALVLIVVGVGLAVVLLIAFGNGQHTDQLDAIKTAGTIVVGTGGAAALWLTARRQQAIEIALNQAKDAHALQERTAAATVADAEARRITELYTKAVDQLGSDKAPVRLGGLYALERLAQDNPTQRPTIVNVLCAYLRMPYPTAYQPPATDAPEPEHARFETLTQERQVRLTAQSILAAHLSHGVASGHRGDMYWPDIDLDLTGATLISFSLSGCRLRTGRFDLATFVEGAHFSRTEFVDNAYFIGTRFTDDVWFLDARIAGAEFAEAKFAGDAWFDGVRFLGRPWFTRARFGGAARFNRAEFVEDELFAGLGVSRDNSMQGMEFSGTVELASARFSGDAPFDGKGSWVRMDVDDSVANQRSWPAGWIVEPCSDRPRPEAEGQWTRLVYRPDLHPDSPDSTSR